MNNGKLVQQRYRLEQLLGEGGMGKVWRAKDLQTGQIVAVKRVNPQIVQNETDLKRVLREARLLQQFDHPNIVKILAFFEEWRRYYLVMPYLPGGSLFDLIERENQVVIPKIKHIGGGICRALVQLHETGIYHRDIKPENILLDAGGNPVLTDFGLARYDGGTVLTAEGYVVGSLSHISPEECRGQKGDERSDIWRLGIMFYEMLTGVSPFERDTLEKTFMAVLNAPIPPPDRYRPDVPDELVALIDVMLQRDPARRIASAKLVGAALRRVPDHAAREPLSALRPID